MKKRTKSQIGKKNRQSGAAFERKVRADLESKGWVVDRWTNNVEFGQEIDMSEYGDNRKIFITNKELEKHIKNNGNFPIKAHYNKIGKLIPAKSRFGLRTTGFPDFIAIYSFPKIMLGLDGGIFERFKGHASLVIGVECKSNGYLSKEEKEKCKWLLENNIFSKILIAKKGKKRGSIEYEEINP